MGGFKDGYEPTQDDLDNHANQLNPDHEEYWHCRESEDE